MPANYPMQPTHTSDVDDPFERMRRRFGAMGRPVSEPADFAVDVATVDDRIVVTAAVPGVDPVPAGHSSTTGSSITTTVPRGSFGSTHTSPP